MLAHVTRIVDGLDARAEQTSEEEVARIVANYEAKFASLEARCPHAKDLECDADAVVVVILSKPTNVERWIADRVRMALGGVAAYK